ncbi:unnamed protein product [Schistosoma intercalatum]|nr:unnamed protein product [Schistosoma intercalatum]CAH8459904.1 unnamed protein product [Schistosoma intercalatum]
MGSALGIIILICLLNESIKASEVPSNITKQFSIYTWLLGKKMELKPWLQSICAYFKKELSDVNERDKRLKVMFSNFQESKHHNDEFQPNVNSTIISRIWELFNHCFLTFDNLAKLIQNDHALK